MNEATLIGVEVDERRWAVAVTFSVLALPESCTSPDDSWVQLVFTSVGRIAASLRNGSWDDADAEVVPFGVADLLAVVRSFDSSAIYGWEFFDTHDKELANWVDRLCLDWGEQSDGMHHSIALFQKGLGRHLDLCTWFESFVIRTPSGKHVTLGAFCAGGHRWWEALHAGDSRTDGHGIVPLEHDSQD